MWSTTTETFAPSFGFLLLKMRLSARPHAVLDSASPSVPWFCPVASTLVYTKAKALCGIVLMNRWRSSRLHEFWRRSDREWD